jgi:uncharacterized protein (DUF2252 family)
MKRRWLSLADRVERGREARREVPRRSHAALDLPIHRDPLAILERQDADRLPELVPLRHARMQASPYAFNRGSAAVMAADLAGAVRTGIEVQLLGDASLSNFGFYASRQQALVFDANNFEETLPGPWEWDVKRLAVSILLACRENGFTPRQCWVIAQNAVRTYRERMHQIAAMPNLDAWYARIPAADIATVTEVRRDRLDSLVGRSRRRDLPQALASLSEVVDGRRRIVDNPPLIAHVGSPGTVTALEALFDGYREGLTDELRELLARYRFADAARVVVGVASVGTRRFLVLLEGRDPDDIQFLLAIEARSSVLEPHLGPSEYESPGERVVAGQRLIQARPDIFLGSCRDPGPDGRCYYWRRLREMSGAVDVATLRIPGMTRYAALCAAALARAHARSGDAVAIASYLGTAETFDGAVADFAEGYADVAEQDHAAFVEATGSERASGPPQDAATTGVAEA